MSAEPARDERAALAVQNIAISRMDGVRSPFRLDDLSTGINLVHGPNGIGKSRTAEAIQAVIWSDTLLGRAEIIGTMSVSDSIWRVEVDMGRVTHQRDGLPQSQSILARQASSHRSRYLLTLQELLRADNRDFADEIRQEAAGGFDLPGAREGLGIPNTSRFRRPTKELNELREATTQVVKLRQQDHALQVREQSLSGLRQEYEAAIAATQRVRMLERAREYAEARNQLRKAKAERGMFPEPLGQMRGDEYERVQALADQLREEKSKRSQQIHDIDRLGRELMTIGIGRDGLSTTLIPTLRDRLNRLNQAQTEWRQAQRLVESKHGLVESRRERLGANLSETQLSALNTDGLRALSEFVRRKRNVEATLHVQQELQAWLGEIDPVPDLDSLRRGADLLATYASLGTLNQNAVSRLERWTLFAAAALIVIEALLLAIVSSPGFLLFGLFAIPVIWIALTLTHSDAEQMKQIRREFADLGLEAQADWSVAAVSSRLNLVRRDIAHAALDNERSNRWANLAQQRQDAESESADLVSERLALVETYGELPEYLDADSLRTIASSLDAWRDAADVLREAEAAMNDASQQCQNLLDAINIDMRAVGEPEVRDVSEATAAIESLADRVSRASKAKREMEHRREIVEVSIDPRISRIMNYINEIYETLGIDQENDARLRDLCGQVEACLKAQSALEEADFVARAARAHLSTASDFVEMSLEDIDLELEDATAKAARRDQIQKEISAVEAELNQAQQQMQLERALTRKADALDLLKQHRRQKLAETAARQVFEFVQKQNHEVNRPEVFREAETLFTVFTAGAYGLEISDGPDPEFLAIDTATGRTLQLHELSSGTRVQLLLAIRLAFIESMERGPQLPVILDEVLGNTDDVRATAVIHAAIEIARRGRQVVYFTAQRDEIGKWCSCLDDHPAAPEWRVLDLAEIRGKANSAAAPAFDWDPSVFSQTKIPDDADHSSLYTLLEVPPVDFRAEGPDGVDLWYLITDVSALEKLRRRGIRTWGQYCALHRSHHLGGIWSERLHEQAMARARVVETVCKQWRIGRPIPVTRLALQQSGEISETFWDRVVECAELHNWDGADLIAALHAGEVSRFYRSTTESLEEWFCQHGYITDVAPQSEEMIRATVFSVVAPEIQQGLIDEDEVDALMRSMTSDLVPAQ